MKTPEGYEKDRIRRHLNENAPQVWYFVKFSGAFGANGIPDIVGAYRSRLFSIEVKREGKGPTELQKIRMAAIEAAGGKTFWGTANKVIPEFRQWIA